MLATIRRAVRFAKIARPQAEQRLACGRGPSRRGAGSFTATRKPCILNPIEKVGICEVTSRSEEYAGIGVTDLVMSGYPHPEQAYWSREGVLPVLERRGPWRHLAPVPGHRAGPQPVRPAPAEPTAREKAAAS